MMAQIQTPTPAQLKILLSVIGAACVVVPQFFPSLAPYSEILIGIGTALGGGALIRRPGDVPRGRP